MISRLFHSRNAFSNSTSSPLPLRDLALQSNLLRRVPHHAIHSVAASLRTLDLGENRIVELHANALSGMVALDGLRLAGNRIATIGEKVFREANAIRNLNLADNEIRTIDQKAFVPLKKLQVSYKDSEHANIISHGWLDKSASL